MQCKEIIQVIEATFPRTAALGFDNVGLLAGRSEKEVSRIYLALDATDVVIDRAIKEGADMLITHHPLLFSAVKKVTDEDFITRRIVKLIQNDISYYAMHTNYDVLGMAELSGKIMDLQNGEVLDVTYTDEEGNFLRPSAYEDEFPDGEPDEVYEEWKAQIEAFIAHTGHLPTHLDSHHYVHMEHRQLEVIKRLAQEYNLPIRQTRYVDENYFPARCEFYKDGVSFETFKEICSTEGYDTVELVCHPALVDERLMNVSSYNMNRIKELELLKSDAFKQFIKDHNIQIITYADIKNN